MFSQLSLSDIEEELSILNANKARAFKNISAKVLKSSGSSCIENLKVLSNKTVLTGNFQINSNLPVLQFSKRRTH